MTITVQISHFDECPLKFDCPSMTGKEFKDCPNRYEFCWIHIQPMLMPYTFYKQSEYAGKIGFYNWYTVLEVNCNRVVYELEEEGGDELMYESLLQAVHEAGWHDAMPVPYRFKNNIHVPPDYEGASIIVQIEGSLAEQCYLRGAGFDDPCPLPYEYCLKTNTLTVTLYGYQSDGFERATPLTDRPSWTLSV